MKKPFLQFSILLVIVMMIASVIANTVNAAPMGAGVTIDSGKTSKTGQPGSTVKYKLTITNTDAAAIDVKLSAVSAGGWNNPVVVPDALTLAGNSSQEVVVNVPIPGSAVSGQNDVTAVYVKDSADALLASLQLKTKVDVPVTPEPRPTSVPGRPLITMSTYSTGGAKLMAGSEFNLQVTLRNDGQVQANNVVVAFDGADFFPRETGGVRTAGTITSGNAVTVSQKFLIGDALAWANIAPIKAAVSYTDAAGNAYTENFTISIVIAEPSGSGTSATATPSIPQRPQLVVTGYSTDIDPLQPGSIFALTLNVKNLGTADAKGVSVVVGGGVSATDDMGTPQAGGISTSGSDLTTFAPLGSSNVVFMGDISKEAMASVTQQLVVNVTAAPGAYTLKLSFVYTDAKGNRQVDDQVITLLVYSLPQVEVSFYRDPGFFNAGMEGILPLQITNLGKKTYVLGNMKVTAENADVYNNVLLVGALDPGGYYTLDASLMPYQEGPLKVKITINYSDDFNQPRTIEQVIPLEIQPPMEIPPDMGGVDGGGTDGGGVIEPQPETFWQKVARFFKGLFGLGSGKGEEPTVTEPIMPGEDIVVPAIPKG
ncbi:MAG TPA: hypothetical protein PK883_05815 [Anaerolineaceae bacterium]|nr:hypothetical protein [Anaerolineaceae bacterium]